MASVLEAMLFDLTNKPALTTPSLFRTTALAIDVFGSLFQRARSSSQDGPAQAQILVVDDDALSNRLVVSALRRAQLQARSTEDPFVALQWLQTQRYDLVLLDIVMPGMDGFELCQRLRRLPGYEKTPVIYVTGHSDFENRARSALSGGDDLLGKPVFPLELAVKAMTHLLIGHTAAKAAPG
jgi:CheY-like chemotaxis protein